MGGGAGEGVGRGREGGWGWRPGKRRSRGELTDERGIEEVLGQDMVEERRSIVATINLAVLPWGTGQF